jgi:hypothetical protein
MQTRSTRTTLFGAMLAAAATIPATIAPVYAHHSFAMYDREQALVFTGVVSSIDPDTNHLMIQFAPMNAARDGVLRDAAGKPIIWALEMQAASAVARYGITPTEFPAGTIFSGAIYPARSGAHSGTQVMGEHSERVLFKCPGRMPPEPGQHCDSVAGSTVHGTAEALPKGTGTIEDR